VPAGFALCASTPHCRPLTSHTHTQVGLLYAMLDFERDAETFAAYDRMTAHELFIRMGLSKRLVIPPCHALSQCGPSPSPV
jgi:hypothetical protein